MVYIKLLIKEKNFINFSSSNKHKKENSQHVSQNLTKDIKNDKITYRICR